MAVHAGSTRSTARVNPTVSVRQVSAKPSETEALATGAVPAWHGACTADALTRPGRLSWQQRAKAQAPAGGGHGLSGDDEEPTGPLHLALSNVRAVAVRALGGKHRTDLRGASVRHGLSASQSDYQLTSEG